MHLYNAWLPPPVAEQTKRESESFAAAVRFVKSCWLPSDPDSVDSTLNWISILLLFVKAKSEVSVEDVKELVEFGFEVFHAARNKLYAQVRWGRLLILFLKKHGKRLSLKIQWRPLYDTLVLAHFKRNTGPEGWTLRQDNFETVTSLIRSCRKFFPAGSASEIWTEFRPLMDNPWHNSSFEGSGFIRLFLPVNDENQSYFSSEWVSECLDLWVSLPNCQFWDIQWASVFARCIKNCKSIDWECFLPALFMRYLNMFEVPVSNSRGSYPCPLEVPSNTIYLFSSKMRTPAKSIAKSIVYLLRPGSLAQEYFERLANLLEHYYHPSNGGQWTNSLERFLRYLVNFFKYRIKQEEIISKKQAEFCLGKSERVSFVKVILKLIDRGQHSKNESLAETVAVATSVLSYVEPCMVLPFVASRFQLALETMTATHQLETAITSVAYASRALLLFSFSSPQQIDGLETADACMDLLMISLSNALLGMDANDPPKTLATMQLICSIFSSLATVGVNGEGPEFLQTQSFSGWLDEFFCRLFSLLHHLEPSSVLNEGLQPSLTSGTFLVEDNLYYFYMIAILLGKLSQPLFHQSLKIIAKFVNTNILPGAAEEVGLLCCACVLTNPEEAVVHLIKPLLMSIISSLEDTAASGFAGIRVSDASFSTKATISPALETVIEYYLSVISLPILYGGPALLRYKDELKNAITSAFLAPSWKVKKAGDYVLRYLLRSLIFYYPIEQYKTFSCHPAAPVLEGWSCSKDYRNEKKEAVNVIPKWHIPIDDELTFANELLKLHFESALDDLLKICQGKLHTDPGNEKERLKVTLLRINSSLQGVMSCLPDMHPSCKNNGSKDLNNSYFLIAGAVGSSIGSSEMRERAAQIIHVACRYILKERSDDSSLLILLVKIMDALGCYGNIEYEEWLNDIEAWNFHSPATVEPPCNFIVSSHAEGSRRPRWWLIEQAFMHNKWRASLSSYYKFYMDSNLSPSDHINILIEDLLYLALHNYETVRSLAGTSLVGMLHRWPPLISKCVLILTGNLRDPKTPEHVVLGSCTVLSTRTVLRHLATDAVSFSSFIMGLLSSSPHKSLKAQNAIAELFVEYNIHFSGISRSFLQNSNRRTDGPEFTDLVSHVTSLGVETSCLHWRYNLMANRVLLLLILASRSNSILSSKYPTEISGHFLRILKSQLPQTRMLTVSALNTLLQGAPHYAGKTKSFVEENNLNHILNEEGFFNETMTSLSHDHITADGDSSTSEMNHGGSSFQSTADHVITYFFFDFSASWPRTPSWTSLLRGDIFYSHYARTFKRLIQECGSPVLHALQNVLEDFSNAEERSKQCVAAEAMAGILHSDIGGLLEAWDRWMMLQLNKVILASTVDSTPEWAACIRYAVTGKGRYGTRIPILRQRILDCLAKPLPQSVSTNVVVRRYTFLLAAVIEISPPSMPTVAVEYHRKLMEEILDNMYHSSARVRKVIGTMLSVLCSNLRLFSLSGCIQLQKKGGRNIWESPKRENWANIIIETASTSAANIQKTNQLVTMETSTDMDHETGHANTESQTDFKRMETIFHFILSSLRSGRSSFLLDLVVKLLYPVISLQGTSNKDLSTLAKEAFKLLKWRFIPRPFLESAVSVILSSFNDPNWRTRSASLSYLQTFMYRHTFILSDLEKLHIWNSIEKLLVDIHVEVREHAARVLASLLKIGDEVLSRDFLDRAYSEAQSTLKKRKNLVSDQSTASVHGVVLALAASVLSVPYDMPSWLPQHVTLLAQFISEPFPVKSTVTKAVAEFRRTHADAWNIHKHSFSEEQLEVLVDMSSSSSYFA